MLVALDGVLWERLGLAFDSVTDIRGVLSEG